MRKAGSQYDARACVTSCRLCIDARRNAEQCKDKLEFFPCVPLHCILVSCHEKFEYFRVSQAQCNAKQGPCVILWTGPKSGQLDPCTLLWIIILSWSVQTNYKSSLARVARPFPLDNKTQHDEKDGRVGLAGQPGVTLWRVLPSVISNQNLVFSVTKSGLPICSTWLPCYAVIILSVTTLVGNSRGVQFSPHFDQIPYTRKFSPRENFHQFHHLLSLAKFLSHEFFALC